MADGVFFSYFPTIPYETFDGSGEYKVVTDVFKRVRATLEAKTDKTIYYNYTVRDTETPEIVAYKYYGFTRYHWVVLLMNEMRDPRWHWPLNTRSFDQYVIKKYGSLETAVTTHSHYETRELKAPATGYGYTKDDIVLQGGLAANQDFSYAYAGKTWGSSATIIEIDAYEKELQDNEDKRSIVLLRRNLLSEFVDEFENLIVKRK